MCCEHNKQMKHILHKMRNYWKHLKTRAKPTNKHTKRFSKMNKQQNDHWEQWTKCKGQSETMRDKILIQKYKNKRPKMKQTDLRCKSMRTRIKSTKKSSEKNFFTQNKTKRTWSPWFETKNKNRKMVSSWIHKCQNHNHKNWLKTMTTTQKNKMQKQIFNTKKKHVKRNMKKNGEDSDLKLLLPENKDERGGRINFQKTKLRPEA